MLFRSQGPLGVFGPDTSGDTSKSIATINISNVDPALIASNANVIDKAMAQAALATGSLDRLATAQANIFKDAGSYLNGAVDNITHAFDAASSAQLEGFRTANQSAWQGYQASLSAQTPGANMVQQIVDSIVPAVMAIAIAWALKG